MTDTAAKFSEYAHPEKLVSTQWVADHVGDEDVVVLESNEDALLYSTGHIPGAQRVEWHTELNDPVTRDFVGPEGPSLLVSLYLQRVLDVPDEPPTQ